MCWLRRNKNKVRVGSLVEYNNVLCFVNLICDDKESALVDKRVWYCMENKVEYCKLVDIYKLRVLSY